ncbi:unnamed protein product, partial [Ectocarpus sp. 6 AP-2014]
MMGVAPDAWGAAAKGRKVAVDMVGEVSCSETEPLSSQTSFWGSQPSAQEGTPSAERPPGAAAAAAMEGTPPRPGTPTP